MNPATPASTILIAAVIAIIFGLIAGLMTGFADTTLISLVGLFSFLAGIITPWVAKALSAQRGQSGRQPPRSTAKRDTAAPAASQASNPDGSDQVTLYVGNLPFKTSEESVQDTFAVYGHVFAVRLVKDRRTGKRKGYGFVEMEPVGAELALAKLNDSDFEGRTLKVRMANSDRKD